MRSPAAPPFSRLARFVFARDPAYRRPPERSPAHSIRQGDYCLASCDLNVQDEIPRHGTRIGCHQPVSTPAQMLAATRVAENSAKGVVPPATFSSSSSESSPVLAGFAGSTMCQLPASSSWTMIFGSCALGAFRYLAKQLAGSVVNSLRKAAFSQQRLTSLASMS